MAYEDSNLFDVFFISEKRRRRFRRQDFGTWQPSSDVKRYFIQLMKYNTYITVIDIMA